MTKSLNDIPNEIIDVIFGYLAQVGIIHVGLVFSRISRHNVSGDLVGKQRVRSMNIRDSKY